MSTFDVRNQKTTAIETIIFHDERDVENNGTYGYKLKLANYSGECGIYDSNDGYVVLKDAAHARNLVKAIEKAIELNWLE